jgi:SAM-dependent methyltransferase
MQEPADGIIDHYERHARAWDADRRMAGWNDKIWHDRFIAALRSAANVLDLGCGSGYPLAQHMAQRGLNVTGVDSSPTLISLCRERLPDHEWLVGDMQSLQLSRQFDGVLAWDSFFHLRPDDQRRMFSVFARHAAPSAILMFNSGPAHGESIGEYRGDPSVSRQPEPRWPHRVAGASYRQSGYAKVLTSAHSRAAKNVVSLC